MISLAFLARCSIFTPPRAAPCPILTRRPRRLTMAGRIFGLFRHCFYRGDIMKFYRYWAMAEQPGTDATGKRLLLRKWAGSNDGEGDAQSRARRALEDLAARVSTLKLGHGRRGDDYAYGTGDIPEELVEQFGDDDDPAGAVTRNRYGCRVLNAREVFIADVDLPAPGFFARLRGRTTDKMAAEKTALLKNWLERNPGAGARIYRTAAGLRYIFTHAPQPVNDTVLAAMKALGGDPLYARLCKRQDCFRARLEPKPWRLGLERPPAAFPFARDEDRRAFRDWHDDFTQKAQDYAVCRYVGTLGETRVHPDLAPLLRVHDDATGCDSDLPLA